MAFLRVLRDKRGYETSYLMHWFRDGARQRSRVLYVFRSPSGARVGRTALDRAAQHELETRYPDIDFDWHAVREHQQVIEPAPEIRRRRPKRDPAEAASRPPETSSTIEAPRAAPPPPVPRPIPAVIEGSSPDEQMGFLARWHPEIRGMILLRHTDPQRQAALLALAERLNPAGWTDADEITTGLQDAAEALDRLSRVFSRRRRRARKRKVTPGQPATAGLAEGASPDPEPAEDVAADADTPDDPLADEPD